MELENTKQLQRGGTQWDLVGGGEAEAAPLEGSPSLLLSAWPLSYPLASDFSQWHLLSVGGGGWG